MKKSLVILLAATLGLAACNQEKKGAGGLLYTIHKSENKEKIKEGDIIGYRSLLCGENFQAKAEAMTDIEATFLPADVFMYLLEIDPQLSFVMLQKISYELGESSNTITFLAQKTVRERLAEILLLLEQKLGVDPEGFIKISLTREEIANIIGTATESAIRLISEFKGDNLIEVDGRNIKILNHDKLMKLGHVVL